MNPFTPEGRRFLRCSLVLSIGLLPATIMANEGVNERALDHALAAMQTRAEMLNKGAYFIYERENLLRVEDGVDLSGSHRDLIVELIHGDNLAIEILTKRTPDDPNSHQGRRYMAARDGVEHSYWWDMNEGSVSSSGGTPWPLDATVRPAHLISRFELKASVSPRPVGYELHQILNPRLNLKSEEDRHEAREKWLNATDLESILHHALGLHRHSVEHVDPDTFQINITLPEHEPGFVKHQPRFEVHADGALKSIEWYSTSDPARLKRSITVEDHMEVNGVRIPRVYTHWSCTGGDGGNCPYESRFRVTIREMGFLAEEDIPAAFFNFRNIFPDSTSVTTPSDRSTREQNEGFQYRFMEMPSLLDEFYTGGFEQALVDMDYEDYPARQRDTIDVHLELVSRR